MLHLSLLRIVCRYLILGDTGMNYLTNIRRHLLLLLLLKVFLRIAELELLPVASRLASAGIWVCKICGVLACRIISS